MNTQLTFPAHMVESLKESLNDFDKDGYIFDRSNGSTEPDGTYHITINADGKDLMRLGIKIGYKLAGK